MATNKQVNFFKELIAQGRKGSTMTRKVQGDPAGASVRDMWEAIAELLGSKGTVEKGFQYNEDYNRQIQQESDNYKNKLSEGNKTIIKSIKQVEAEGGGTLDPNTMEIKNPTSGYMVANKEGELIIEKDKLTPEVIRDYVEQQLPNGYQMGMWYNPDDGKVYIDAVQHIEDKEEAIALGKKNNQWSIWDAKEQKTIDLNVREKEDNK